MILVTTVKKKNSLFLSMRTIPLTLHHRSVLSEARRLCSKLSRAILLTARLRIISLDNIGLLHETAPAKLIHQMNLYLFQTPFTRTSGWNVRNLHSLVERCIDALLFLRLTGNPHRPVSR